MEETLAPSSLVVTVRHLNCWEDTVVVTLLT
jgi:hypothetical protein